MKKLSLFCTFACILLIIFTACKKSNKSASKTDMLTSGTWKMTALHSDTDGNGSFETDEFSGFPSCVQDNFFTFKSGGDFITDDGATKCDPADDQTQTSSWAFSQNETKITIDGDL
ncbi:MAG TPA: hypothetical protein VFV08_00870, partial [Puia sp.]|nr:hypothetical protein [Puia sp.]